MNNTKHNSFKFDSVLILILFSFIISLMPGDVHARTWRDDLFKLQDQPIPTYIQLQPNPVFALELPALNAEQSYFGKITLGNGPHKNIALIVDSSERDTGVLNRLWIDMNNNSEFDDDEYIDYSLDLLMDGSMMIPFGTVRIMVDYDIDGRIKMRSYNLNITLGMSSDGAGPRIAYTAAGYVSFEAALDNSSLEGALIEKISDGIFGKDDLLTLDLNQNGVLESKNNRSGELVPAGRPFLFEGRAWQLDTIFADGSGISFKTVESAPDYKALVQGDPAPEFSLPLINGGKAALSELKGKVVTLIFWATHSRNSANLVRSIPMINSNFPDLPQQIIPVSLDKSVEDVKSWLAKNKLIIDVAADGQGWNSPIARNYMVESLPTVITIDPDGKIYNNNAPLGIQALVADLQAIVPGAADVTAGIKWHNSVDKALKLAMKDKKPVMIDFFTTWCGPCHLIDDRTYSDPSVVAYSSNFICVKIDAEKDVQAAMKYKISAYPTIILLNPEGAIVKSITGFRGPASYLQILKGVIESL
jgi:thiol-disulfide isomerase/thioredoxin